MATGCLLWCVPSDVQGDVAACRGDAGLDRLVGVLVLLTVAQVLDATGRHGDRAGVADADPAAVGHPHAGLLAGLEDRGGPVDLDLLAGVRERDGATAAAAASVAVP